MKNVGLDYWSLGIILTQKLPKKRETCYPLLLLDLPSDMSPRVFQPKLHR